jgi:hypothetical protein
MRCSGAGTATAAERESSSCAPRKPQDYFHRVWSTAFRAADLTDVHEDDDGGEYDEAEYDDNDAQALDDDLERDSA